MHCAYKDKWSNFSSDWSSFFKLHLISNYLLPTRIHYGGKQYFLFQPNLTLSPLRGNLNFTLQSMSYMVSKRDIIGMLISHSIRLVVKPCWQTNPYKGKYLSSQLLCLVSKIKFKTDSQFLKSSYYCSINV